MSRHLFRGEFRRALLVFGALASLAAGCSRDYPPQREQSPPSPSADQYLAVVIRLPGDDFAGEQELQRRDSIARLIEEGGLGQVVLKGTGMGSVEVVFRVSAEGDIHRRLREIVLQVAPDRPYLIEERPEPLQPSPSTAQ